MVPNRGIPIKVIDINPILVAKTKITFRKDLEDVVEMKLPFSGNDWTDPRIPSIGNPQS